MTMIATRDEYIDAWTTKQVRQMADWLTQDRGEA